MRLTFRDGIVTVLIAAIAVPYVGFVIRGSMPLLNDVRGMAGVGLALGVVAFLVLDRRIARGRLGVIEQWVLLGAGVLGILSLTFAEGGGAQALLAVFMVAIALAYALEMGVHTGVLRGRAERGDGLVCPECHTAQQSDTVCDICGYELVTQTKAELLPRPPRA